MTELLPYQKPSVNFIETESFLPFTAEGWVKPLPEIETFMYSDEEMPEIKVTFVQLKTGETSTKFFNNMSLDEAFEKLLQFNKDHEFTRCTSVSKVNELSRHKGSRFTLCAPTPDPVLWEGYHAETGANILSEEYLIPDVDAVIDEILEYHPELEDMVEILDREATQGD